MKLEEDYGPPDRIFGIETDDEDNEADTDYNHEDDSESETSVPSRHPSLHDQPDSDPSWPQSYR